MSDVLKELGAELQNLTTSPGFASRVRERVASESRRPPVARWLLLASSVGMTVSIGYLSLSSGVPETTTSPPATSAAPAPPIASVPQAASQTTSSQTPPAPIQRGRAATTADAVPRLIAAAAPQTTDDRFEVITTQRAVLERLWRHATAPAPDRRTAPALPPPATVIDADGRLVVPELAIDPIVVPAIGTGPGGGGRIQRLVLSQATGSPR
jgi:hypothetical protein